MVLIFADVAADRVPKSGFRQVSRRAQLHSVRTARITRNCSGYVISDPVFNAEVWVSNLAFHGQARALDEGDHHGKDRVPSPTTLFFAWTQVHRMESLGHEVVPFEDVVCQMWDMLKLGDRSYVTLQVNSLMFFVVAHLIFKHHTRLFYLGPKLS